jgi:hypothetical protein
MAEKAAKRKAKPKRSGQSVLGTLPASRPERIGRPRRGEKRKSPEGAVAKPRAAAARASAGGAAKRAAKKPAAKRAAAAKPAARRPSTAAKPAARRSSATAKPKPAPRRPSDHGPAAVSPGSPPLRARRFTDEPPPKPIGAPTGTVLVTTTIRAAGELAQIGLTVGGQVLKRTLDRIPRP